MTLQIINGEPVRIPARAVMGAEFIDPEQRNRKPGRLYLSTFDRARYSDAYLLSCVPEADVQRAALDLLAAECIPALAVDAGAAKLRGHVCRALKSAGVRNAGAIMAGGAGASFAGLTDIIGTMPGGRALYIECKAPAWYRIGRGGHMRVVRGAGEPTGDQLAFMDRMAEAGALVGVCWSPEDVMDAIRAGVAA